MKSVNVFFELKEKLAEKKSEVTLYSYWMTEPAIICSLIKKYSNLNIKKQLLDAIVLMFMSMLINKNIYHIESLFLQIWT